VWRHIAQSLQGPSHVADGTRCQDCNGVCLLGEGAAATVVACIADGAGSARFADAGSTIACKSILENANAYFSGRGTFQDFDRNDALRWCDDIHSRIRAAAAERDCQARELATTLSVVIAAPQSSTFFQIGDGVIVLRCRGVYGVVFWPQSGEYANSTNFLTSDDYQEQLDFLTIKSGCSNFALLTDGLERLALSFNQQTPHAPFFEPLFKALRNTDDLAGLTEGLRKFLASDSVRLRSDDDKTLIVASREHADDAA
jgi:hypothetical protein